MARVAFVLDAHGAVVAPAPDPLGGAVAPEAAALARAAEGCPERGLESCIRDLRAEQRRAARLDAAREAEADRTHRADARRAYQQLVGYDDTGARALFGLARLARADGDHAAAIGYLHEVARRFGARTDGGLALGLVADVGAAELEPGAGALIEVYRRLLDRHYAGPPAALVAAAERVARAAHARATAAEEATLAALDRRFVAARAAAREAAALAPDGPDLARAADRSPAARPAVTVARGRTLVFQRRADGGVAGVVVDDAALARAATDRAALAQLAPGARTVVAPINAPPPPRRPGPGDGAAGADPARARAGRGQRAVGPRSPRRRHPQPQPPPRRRSPSAWPRSSPWACSRPSAAPPASASWPGSRATSSRRCRTS